MIVKKKPSTTVGLARRPVTASTSVTANVQNRRQPYSKVNSVFASLTPEQQAFTRQIQHNTRKGSAIMGATNTSNIAARPDFLALLPLFTQQLHITDVFGSIAMKSRQQLVPFFKFMAANTKGETKAGDILSSPMVNRQGVDGNFTGRVVKNETLLDGEASATATLFYHPILPGSVTLVATIAGEGQPIYFTDDGTGKLAGPSGDVGSIAYDTGIIEFDEELELEDGDTLKAVVYQYDNETVGPDANGNHGAMMGKGYLMLDEFNLVAEARQLACYTSIYAAFAAQQEYGGNLEEIQKEAAFSELTAEINTSGFRILEQAAAYKPQFNWNAAPVLEGSVVPSDYLNMFGMKLDQASASIYEATRLSRPNRIVMGSNVATYARRLHGFQPETVAETVGPYKLGTYNEFTIYVEPNYDPNKWVMCCKSSDIRRNSALYGQYMPFVETPAVQLADASIQQGYATMMALKVVNAASVVSGKIVGAF